MARHNLVFLLGFVQLVELHESLSGEPFALAFVTVVRGTRNVGDGKRFPKTDNPCIMSRNPDIINEMKSWKVNDIVEIKGPIAVRAVNKASYCNACREKNVNSGVMVYINPIFAKKRNHFETQDECIVYLNENREVSNQAFMFGTLCREPKKVLPKAGLIVTQYQIALNRKFRIRQDPPEIKADYPWVKSYGENAIQDRDKLHTGSQIFIDGCLQARNVKRQSKCSSCGAEYSWKDRALEIVPYEVEYIANFYTDEEVAAKKEQQRREMDESVRQAAAKLGIILPDGEDYDILSEQDIEDGYMEECDD